MSLIFVIREIKSFSLSFRARRTGISLRSNLIITNYIIIASWLSRWNELNRHSLNGVCCLVLPLFCLPFCLWLYCHDLGLVWIGNWMYRTQSLQILITIYSLQRYRYFTLSAVHYTYTWFSRSAVLHHPSGTGFYWRTFPLPGSRTFPVPYPTDFWRTVHSLIPSRTSSFCHR
jgi:hypothetical protein